MIHTDLITRNHFISLANCELKKNLVSLHISAVCQHISLHIRTFGFRILDNFIIIAPAFSKVRYRGSTFRPFVRSFVLSSVRPSVRPQFASSLENLRRVWE